jgi:hypothetical protein
VLAADSNRQIEHMEIDRGVAQQMSEVPESFSIFQTKGSPTVAYGPVLALFAERPRLRNTETRPRVAGSSRARSSAPRFTCHPNFSRPMRPNFW